jgi:hypothetical protein
MDPPPGGRDRAIDRPNAGCARRRGRNLGADHPGAIANAIYDAIGVRVRDMPFTPERVRAALAG